MDFPEVRAPLIASCLCQGGKCGVVRGHSGQCDSSSCSVIFSSVHLFSPLKYTIVNHPEIYLLHIVVKTTKSRVKHHIKTIYTWELQEEHIR